MYNIYNYNTETFSANSQGVDIWVQDEIVFDWYSLSNNTVKVNKISFDNSHEVQSETFNRPLSDGWGELNYFLRQKTVTMRGRIKADSKEELYKEIDRFKRSVIQSEKDLDIKVNGVVRRAKASLMNPGSMFDREHYNVTFLPFEITFRVLEKFQEIQRVIDTYTWMTWTFIEESYNEGTAKAEPIWILSFSSASGVNSVSMNIWGEEITISDSISAGDILTIDTIEKQVLLNSVDIDYIWTFPKLNVWNNSYTITVNGTCNFSFTIYYFNTYL